jgi:hypothetical protein
VVGDSFLNGNLSVFQSTLLSNGLVVTNNSNENLNACLQIEGVSSVDGASFLSSSSETGGRLTHIPSATSTSYNPIVQSGDNLIYLGYKSDAGVSTSSVITNWSTVCNGLRWTENKLTVGMGGNSTDPLNSISFDSSSSTVNVSTGGTLRMTISSTGSQFNYGVSVVGNLTITSGTCQAPTFTSGSDYRIKENVKPLDSSLYNVDNLIPVIYNLRETKETNIGFLAHEVQESFPFLVSGVKDGKETQTVNYMGLIGVLTKEIQELKKDNKIMMEMILKLRE